MQPYIRGGILEFFAETVRHCGGDPQALLSEADVAPEVLSVPGIFLPYASYLKLMHLASKTTDTPHFGLLMARAANAETLGTIGIIMTQADTVANAWETLAHFYSIHDTYGKVTVSDIPGAALISYRLPRIEQSGARQVLDVAAGITVNIMRRLCGPDFRARAISFPYPQPADLSPYADLPAEHVGFGSIAMEMQVPQHYMGHALQGSNNELRLALDGFMAQQGTNRRHAVRQVEDMIRRLLPTGDCTLPRVAETLATTPRTLQARLETEQSSFREILETVRREIATFHLRHGDMQLTQLAMVLGYSELSAFSRSFRSWYGMSPRQWVAQGSWLN